MCVVNLAQFEKDISEAQALEALAAFPGVSIINDRQNNRCDMGARAGLRAGSGGRRGKDMIGGGGDG